MHFPISQFLAFPNQDPTPAIKRRQVFSLKGAWNLLRGYVPPEDISDETVNAEPEGLILVNGTPCLVTRFCINGQEIALVKETTPRPEALKQANCILDFLSAPKDPDTQKAAQDFTSQFKQTAQLSWRELLSWASMQAWYSTLVPIPLKQISANLINGILPSGLKRKLSDHEVTREKCHAKAKSLLTNLLVQSPALTKVAGHEAIAHIYIEDTLEVPTFKFFKQHLTKDLSFNTKPGRRKK